LSGVIIFEQANRHAITAGLVLAENKWGATFNVEGTTELRLGVQALVEMQTPNSVEKTNRDDSQKSLTGRQSIDARLS
jgi:hypothetical protein